MPMLDDKVKAEVTKVLSAMQNPVTLKFYTQEFECGLCKETHELLKEIAELNPQVKLVVKDFVQDASEAKEDGIDKIPAIAVLGEKDYGIRFYGIPAGYEFSSLLNAILMVSTKINKLKDATKAFLKELKTPLHLQVFVTPTCPYCPKSVILAHQMAMESDMVKADMVEISEFPHMGTKYQVQGVPRTVINEKWHIEGAAPERMMVDKLKEVISG